jgi:hypothetical protein
MRRFRADCSRCCGLCCVAPAFLAVQGFGHDKPADAACRHLTCTGRCAVYAERAAVGYPSCAGFDCFGAGQWITQDLFAGARWSDSPEIGEQMFAAYRYWAPRFEASALLNAALPLVRDDARSLINCRIDMLSRGDAGIGSDHTDAASLRRDTLALILSAMPIKHE